MEGKLSESLLSTGTQPEYIQLVMSFEIYRRPSLLQTSETHAGSARKAAQSGFADFIFWTTGLTVTGGWAYLIAEKVVGKISLQRTLPLEDFLSKNAGLTSLLAAVSIIAVVCLASSIVTLLGRKVYQPLASLILVSGIAIRALQLFHQSSASIQDADLISGLFLLAALIYRGGPRLWWLFMMPLGTAASLAPLIWLEFFKGASHPTLSRALIAPATAFVLSSILLVARELRSHNKESLLQLQRVQSRGLELKKQMHSMENDLKSLLSLISVPRFQSDVTTPTPPAITEISLPTHDFEEEASQGPMQTTDFTASASAVSVEASTYEEIDRGAREALDDALSKIAGKPNIRLLLTGPSGSNLPFAVRVSKPALVRWLKALIANSIDSLGGFPNGVVRVTLRPGLSSVLISIEDNGRGFGEDLLVKLGAQEEGRMTSLEVRKEVEAAGGRFDVQARLGVGARLTIELPRVDVRSSSTSARPNDFRQTPSSSLHA